MENNLNSKENLTVEVGGQNWASYPIKTHKIAFSEDLISIVEKYAKPKFQNGGFIAISEKVVSVCQNNVRHISTVKAGFLAKLIVKFVKKYPNDIGYSRAEKMQVAVETAGRPRMILAIIIGGVSKAIGIHGTFWVIAGNRVSEIDGFNPGAMYPYTEYAILPPKDPRKVCQDIEDKLGIPAVIVDSNNINVKVIDKSSGVPLDNKAIRRALLHNPMGQDDEMTPIVLLKPSTPQ